MPAPTSPMFVILLILSEFFSYAGTFFDNLIAVFPKLIPERILDALKRSDGIDFTFSFGAFDKNTFIIVFSNTFFDGKSVADSFEIFLDEFDGIFFQKTGNLKDFLLIYPNITGLATAAEAWTGCTCTGVKSEIKPISQYDAHDPHPCSFCNSSTIF